MTQLSLVPRHWLHLQCACCRHQANVPVATFIAKGLQTIAQIRNTSRCTNCSRRGEVELTIYFRNSVDVKNIERNGDKNEHNYCC
jgi:sRNA-binding regulator protein Hfq